MNKIHKIENQLETKKEPICVGCQSDSTSAQEAFKVVELLLAGKTDEARGLLAAKSEKTQRKADEYIKKTYTDPLMRELGIKV